MTKKIGRAIENGWRIVSVTQYYSGWAEREGIYRAILEKDGRIAKMDLKSSEIPTVDSVESGLE